jgi:hypothetical protein
MTWDYEPVTEEQIEAERSYPLLEDGVYNFQVLVAKEKLSSTGNAMIALELLVWNHDGKEFKVFDNLMAMKNMQWKAKHFCDTTGLAKEYAAKEFNADMALGKTGKVSIITQVGKPKGDGTNYKDKNAVEDYVLTDKGATRSDAAQPAPKDEFSDDIPF